MLRLAARRRNLAAALCAAALGLAGAGVHAAPDDADDPVSRLLQEKGWIDSAAAPFAEAPRTGFVGQVRDRAADLVVSAMNFLGVPYRRGGNSDDGFDCSGFTRHIFEASLGLVLPRRVDEQAGARGLHSVKRDQLQPGDLVFFNTLRRTFSHVGIYVGEGKFIHSPRTGGQVRLEDMRQAYWSKRFTGARRAETLGTVAAVSGSAATSATPSTRLSGTADAEAARVLY
jgi:cell wall-associated NlpC family hydrolase